MTNKSRRKPAYGIEWAPDVRFMKFTGKKPKPVRCRFEITFGVEDLRVRHS